MRVRSGHFLAILLGLGVAACGACASPPPPSTTQPATAPVALSSASPSTPPPARATPPDAARGPRWLAQTPALAPFDVLGPACAGRVTLQRQRDGDPAITYAVQGRHVDANRLAESLKAAAATNGAEVRVSQEGELTVSRSRQLVIWRGTKLTFGRRVPEEVFAEEARLAWEGTELSTLVEALGGMGSVLRVNVDRASSGARSLEVLLRIVGPGDVDADDRALARWAKAHGLAGHGDRSWGSSVGDDVISLRASSFVRDARLEVSFSASARGMNPASCADEAP